MTGSSGFIGRRLLHFLKGKGHEAIGVDDEYFQDLEWRGRLNSILEISNPDVVFHVGACSDTLELDVQYMMTRNYEATKVITDWCVANNRKMIYSSSAANYGENGHFPSNLYGWSKYVAEDYVVNRGGLALRYFNVYGPGEEGKGTMASYLYQAYIKNKLNQEIKIFPGKPLRDFVYIEDVVSANCHAEDNYKDLSGTFYEVSTGVAHSFEEKLKLFSFDYSYFKEEDIPQGYQFYTCGKPEKWMPGWTPKYSLKEGVSEYKAILEAGDHN